MRAKHGTIKDVKGIESDKDSAYLLFETKGVVFECNGHRNPYLTLNNKKQIIRLLSKGE